MWWGSVGMLKEMHGGVRSVSPMRKGLRAHCLWMQQLRRHTPSILSLQIFRWHMRETLGKIGYLLRPLERKRGFGHLLR